MRVLTVGTWFLSISMLVVVAMLQASGKTHAWLLFGDAREMVSAPIYAGWLSDLGVLCWIAAAAVATFTVLAVDSPALHTRHQTCLGVAAGITVMLALDDLWLLHENAWPAMGVPSAIVYGVYGLSVLCWLVYYRSELWSGAPRNLGIGLALFSLSVGLDVVPEGLRPFGEWHALVEDGAKWLGIVAWSLWMVGRSLVLLQLKK